jgi:hypothetical protein
MGRKGLRLTAGRESYYSAPSSREVSAMKVPVLVPFVLGLGACAPRSSGDDGTADGDGGRRGP